MINGLTESEISWLKLNVIQPLKEAGAKVYIFGSRANGKFKKFSDVDLLYIEKSPISSQLIFDIITTAQNSHFPYKIDLVNYSELAESYKSSVEKEKIQL